MILLIKFTLITFGFCLLISKAKPLKRIREWITTKSFVAGEFINCVKCMSFWVSPFAYWYVYKEISWDMLPYAFLAFGTTYLLENFKTCK